MSPLKSDYIILRAVDWLLSRSQLILNAILWRLYCVLEFSPIPFHCIRANAPNFFCSVANRIVFFSSLKSFIYKLKYTANNRNRIKVDTILHRYRSSALIPVVLVLKKFHSCSASVNVCSSLYLIESSETLNKRRAQNKEREWNF